MKRPIAATLPNHRANLDAQLLNICIFVVVAMTAASSLWLLQTFFSPASMTANRGWPESLVLLSFATATLLAASRHLPMQNIALAAVLIGVTGAGVHGMSAATAVPFGPITYTLRIGPKFLDLFSWAMPFVWIIAVLNSRGVARLILRPWRKLKNYGLWLIALTAALVMLFDLALEPFATHIREFWLWQPTKLPWTWYGMPVVNSFVWLGLTVLILSFTTPALIGKKQRPSQSPPDYFPLGAWISFVILCGIGAGAGGLWVAAAFSAVAAIVVGVFAVRGARW